MSDRINGRKAANQLTAELSLRTPQRESLDILVNLLEQLRLDKDPDLQHWLGVIRRQYPSMTAFERVFPSLCFALATGVGKTRLMGAMIAWLYITGRSRHFFVLAPNLTIYEKLKRDFTLGSPKYVFAGIPEMAQTPPVVITGDDYEEGRGVRLDFAVPASMTGDLFGGDSAPHVNIFNIAKINARDNKQGAAKSTTAKVHRLQEYIGESYFEYLAGLPDLVVLMDEAHRYYASAGAQAINDLKPVLGIELTATPKTAGANPRPFKNIVYHYPLSSAIRDGYVKIPAVATRQNFRADQCEADELERIKLEDGVHHHEYVKVELDTYARTQGSRRVKPFMMVVAQDTTHAGTIKRLLESERFFAGRYAGKVIEVHSNQSGEESDDSMQRLLAVEHDEATEIVIHVNKLKEGWDVTNLYTIVPLRASASEILTEQTIGRGLRLPYGKRTGIDAVDRLCIIAHDQFQKIIDRANDVDSILREKIYIGSGTDADVPDRKPQIITTPSWAEMLTTGNPALCNELRIEQSAAPYLVMPMTEQHTKIAQLAFNAVQQEAARLTSSRDLTKEDVRRKLVERVHQILRESCPAQAELAGMEGTPEVSEEELANVVHGVAETVAELTIDVPRIVVLPTREVNYGFDDFDLQHLDRINFQPVSQEILLQHLESEKRERIQWGEEAVRESKPENYIVRGLWDRDEVDYDVHAGLLYKLASQVVARLRSYLSGEDQVENVLMYWQRQLADFVWAQMQEHLWKTPTDYVGKITGGVDVLRPATFTLAAGEQPRNFRFPIADKRMVRQMVFTGFSKCCYPFQKFDSVDGEWRLAQVLEDDDEVLRWMKPAPGQFRIEYTSGQNYEPDFIVETRAGYLIIEPKRADQIASEETRAKMRAAVRWCRFANQNLQDAGGKPWSYLLVPDNKIMLGLRIAVLKVEFEQSQC